MKRYHWGCHHTYRSRICTRSSLPDGCQATPSISLATNIEEEATMLLKELAPRTSSIFLIRGSKLEMPSIRHPTLRPTRKQTSLKALHYSWKSPTRASPPASALAIRAAQQRGSETDYTKSCRRDFVPYSQTPLWYEPKPTLYKKEAHALPQPPLAASPARRASVWPRPRGALKVLFTGENGEDIAIKLCNKRRYICRRIDHKRKAMNVSGRSAKFIDQQEEILTKVGEKA